MKVLVIDDEPTIRELLSLHLSNAGHQVRIAEDAVAGGHMVIAERPDLIILDVNMPYMSGYELVEALKRDESTKDVPVVLLTSSTDVAERSRQVGAAGYLNKPVLATQLVETVERFGRRA